MPDDIPSDLDIAIWNNSQYQKSTSRTVVAPGFLHHGINSHILLAACGEKERAYEDQAEGVFTTALLELLFAVDTQAVTPTNLIQRLPHLLE
jgi:hypothetical protein